ncbi:hypothetical protein ABH941_000022 [Streptacidiphilus sp. EB103A]
MQDNKQLAWQAVADGHIDIEPDQPKSPER